MNPVHNFPPYFPNIHSNIIPAGARNFSLHHRVQTSCGAYSASYPMHTRGSFPGGKTARAWNWPLTSIYYKA
jgi:hypothetical protein